MLLYSAESVLKRVILSQFAVHLSSIFNYLNQCVHTVSSQLIIMEHCHMENSMHLQKVIFIIFYKAAGWKVFLHMNGNLKLFISRIYKNLLCHEKTKYDILFSFMSNSPFKGKVTLLGCCVLTANCIDSSLCAVYGGLPSSFSGLHCPNHSPFFPQLPLPFYVSYFHSPVLWSLNS